VSACGDFQLSVRNLQISPDTALPGDSVVFAFALTVAPAQQFTLNVLIDGATHASEMHSELVDAPLVITVGEAGNLIAQYGTGQHEGAIEVRLRDGARTATARRTFVLAETPPPLGAGVGP
jgi:hypothetical protein